MKTSNDIFLLEPLRQDFSLGENIAGYQIEKEGVNFALINWFWTNLGRKLKIVPVKFFRNQAANAINPTGY